MISPGRILIIDDNRDLADGLAAILEDTGYSATTAYTGLSGIEAFTKTVFDLVFLDVKLPDMDGLEVLQALQSALPNAKVLVISGYPPDQIRAQWPDVRLVRKPFDPGQMLKTVEQILHP
jgi:two-component system OmpR family response regulator